MKRCFIIEPEVLISLLLSLAKGEEYSEEESLRNKTAGQLFVLSI